jgi:predicted SnoaL-like aldol condensation-catalyzing enzyme
MSVNKEIALQFLTNAFVKRDPSAVKPLFGANYRQHNPGFADGAETVLQAIPHLSPNLVYEPGMVVAENDLVMVHGRFTGWGPKPLIAVDIFRIQDGKVVEHWDVVQEEVPADKTASGNPMFTPQ